MKRLFFALCAGLFLFASYGQAQVIYFSDFESDDGGWVGTGDWEWGSPNGFDSPPFGNPEPVGGHSGSNAWGTIIGGAHNPSVVSELVQIFDLTNSVGTELSWWEWADSGSNAFDTAEVIINGDDANPVYLSDGGPTLDWREVVIDLSAFDGQAAVEVNYRFSATGVVERVGWYIDDVTITSVPEPASAAILSIGAIALMARRRKR